MNSIMKHDYNRASYDSQDNKKSPMNLNNIEITSPISPGLYNHEKNKHTIQQLYRNQLDQLLSQKQRYKKLQKQRLQKQKQQYRQNSKIGIQNQKLKNMAYKNYYRMLMQGQTINNQGYVSPYEQRDKIKTQFINSSIDNQQKRMMNFQYEIKKRQVQKRNQYKEQLMRQIQQRKILQNNKKQTKNQQNIHNKQHNQITMEIQNYDRQRKKQEMSTYRNQLDRFMEDKLSQSRKNSQTEPRIKITDDYHNPVTNPLPYNIQNPYILRQLQKSRSMNSGIKNQATVGIYDYNNNYERGASRDQNNQNNQHHQNYFARQGYEMMK